MLTGFPAPSEPSPIKKIETPLTGSKTPNISPDKGAADLPSSGVGDSATRTNQLLSSRTPPFLKGNTVFFAGLLAAAAVGLGVYYYVSILDVSPYKSGHIKEESSQKISRSLEDLALDEESGEQGEGALSGFLNYKYQISGVVLILLICCITLGCCSKKASSLPASSLPANSLPASSNQGGSTRSDSSAILAAEYKAPPNLTSILELEFKKGTQYTHACSYRCDSSDVRVGFADMKLEAISSPQFILKLGLKGFLEPLMATLSHGPSTRESKLITVDTGNVSFTWEVPSGCYPDLAVARIKFNSTITYPKGIDDVHSDIDLTVDYCTDSFNERSYEIRDYHKKMVYSVCDVDHHNITITTVFRGFVEPAKATFDFGSGNSAVGTFRCVANNTIWKITAPFPKDSIPESFNLKIEFKKP